MPEPIDLKLAERIASAVGINVAAAKNRMRHWHPLRWYEPKQDHASGMNHKRPAPRSHPWSSQSYRLKQAEKIGKLRG